MLQLWDNKDSGLVPSGACEAHCLLVEGCRLPGADPSSCWGYRRTKLVGLCFLAPSEQRGLWGLLFLECGFPWCFNMWDGGLWSRGECEAQSFFVIQEVGLTPKC
jgi:hypothetical protein